MTAENPVVARVNGHDIRWAEVVASADDLPERYRTQIESVFPALLDRLCDLRLLADAARAGGLENDARLRQPIVRFEDSVLSLALVARALAETVTTPARGGLYAARASEPRGGEE